MMTDAKTARIRYSAPLSPGARLRKAILGLALFLLACVVIGCGLGGSSPPTLTLVGQVVDALSPTTPISGAYVYVPHIPRTASSRQVGLPEPADSFAITDAEGQFRLEKIPAGDFTIKVAPPEGAGYPAPLEMEFRGIRATTLLSQIRITLLDQATQDQLNASGSARLVPISAVLQVGDTQQFALEITGVDVPTTIAPTWVAWGDVGRINEDGLFTAVRDGQGVVVTYLARFAVSATVTVGSGPQIVVNLNAVPESGDVPLTVSFTGSAQPADAEHPIAEYRLNFGDGSDSIVSANAPANVSHEYQSPGFYTAVLEARDTADRVGFASKRIPVTVAGRLAFASDRDGNFEIYVMNSDGTGLTRLTNNAAVEEVTSWSPDGAKIAFTSDRDSNFEIYVMNSDGTGQTNLTNSPVLDSYPAWSPDGTKIAFMSERDGNQEIYVMNSDGTGQTNKTNNPAEDYIPAWSPDGTKIAFTSDRDGNAYIYVMNSDGTGQSRLTNDPAVDFYSVRSPDSMRIAFVSDRDGNREIYTMYNDGTGQTNLTNNPANDAFPAWSPVP